MNGIVKEVIKNQIDGLIEEYKSNLKAYYRQKDRINIKTYYIPDNKAEEKIKPILSTIREKERILIDNEKIQYIPYLSH